MIEMVLPMRAFGRRRRAVLPRVVRDRDGGKGAMLYSKAIRKQIIHEQYSDNVGRFYDEYRYNTEQFMNERERKRAEASKEYDIQCKPFYDELMAAIAPYKNARDAALAELESEAEEAGKDGER